MLAKSRHTDHIVMVSTVDTDHAEAYTPAGTYQTRSEAIDAARVIAGQEWIARTMVLRRTVVYTSRRGPQ